MRSLSSRRPITGCLGTRHVSNVPFSDIDTDRRGSVAVKSTLICMASQNAVVLNTDELVALRGRAVLLYSCLT